MIIIETCPKCGHDLHDLMLASFPPIPKKECWNCGWSWTGKREEVVRMPFVDDAELENYKCLEVNLDDLTLLNGYNFNNSISSFNQSQCLNCPSNPKNGGDGICFCTLGQMNVVY